MNITADDLVNAAFETEPGEVVCLTRPSKSGRGWVNYAWDPATSPQMIDETPAAWYVCVATSNMQEGGAVRRRRKDFAAAWVLMLDDIGTKAQKPPVEPSVALETSQGNFQYLYFLHGVLLDDRNDCARYETQIKALLDAGYGDDGARGAYRVFRLPGSINMKPGRNRWQTRVTHWAPDRVWMMDDLLRAMGVSVDYDSIPEYKEPPPIPEDVEDPVLDWLISRKGLGAQTDDWYSVVCPWNENHSDGNVAAGYSPLGHGENPHLRGFKCFHAHCMHRTATDYLEWIQRQGGPAASVSGVREFNAQELQGLMPTLTTFGRTEALRSALPELRRSMLPDVQVTSSGVASVAQKPTRPNVEWVADFYGLRLRRNVMSHEITAGFKNPELDAMAPEGDAAMRVLIDGCMRAGIAGEKQIGDIVCEIAAHDQFHPFENWIKETAWDRRPRLDDLAATVRVADDVYPLWRAYLRRWLVQTVQAAVGWRRPQQIASVLVLVGKQGIGKSRWFEALAPQEYVLTGQALHLGGHGHVDSVMRATGRPIVELGEIETTFRASEMGALKAFLAQREDRYRSPYGVKPIDWPRCVSFCASVNRMDFLTDPTGSRRFWPISVERCLPDHNIDMRQVWAEALQWHASGVPWWLEEEEDRQREEQSGEYYAWTEIEQRAMQWLEEHKGSEKAMNVTSFCQLLTVPATRQNISAARGVLVNYLGSPTTCQGIRNAWMVPTAESEDSHLKVVSDREAAR